MQRGPQRGSFVGGALTFWDVHTHDLVGSPLDMALHIYGAGELATASQSDPFDQAGLLTSEICRGWLKHETEGGGWGLLLSWLDRDGVRHEEVFARAMFAGECGELRQRLADGGLSLNGAAFARQAFSEFLNLTQTALRAWSVGRIGWHEFAGRRVFVLGDRTFGDAGARVVLQQAEQEPSPFQSGGTLDDWRSQVSRLCSGNSRLLLAASAGFAAPLLGLLGEDGGGFHFRGASRLGKSTALRVATRGSYGTALPAFLSVLAERLASGHGAFVDGLRERIACRQGMRLAASPI